MKRLLVVDDEPLVREMLQAFFAVHKYDVSAAGTATDARAFAAREHFDAIILDVLLADADGLELLADFKKSVPERPVIIITGLGFDEALLQEAIEKGASGYFSKGTPLSNLAREVERVLAERPAAA